MFFWSITIEYLHYIVSSCEVEMEPTKHQAVCYWLNPSLVMQLHAFSLGSLVTIVLLSNMLVLLNR